MTHLVLVTVICFQMDGLSVKVMLSSVIELLMRQVNWQPDVFDGSVEY